MEYQVKLQNVDISDVEIASLFYVNERTFGIQDPEVLRKEETERILNSYRSEKMELRDRFFRWKKEKSEQVPILVEEPEDEVEVGGEPFGAASFLAFVNAVKSNDTRVEEQVDTDEGFQEDEQQYTDIGVTLEDWDGPEFVDTGGAEDTDKAVEPEPVFDEEPIYEFPVEEFEVVEEETVEGEPLWKEPIEEEPLEEEINLGSVFEFEEDPPTVEESEEEVIRVPERPAPVIREEHLVSEEPEKAVRVDPVIRVVEKPANIRDFVRQHKGCSKKDLRAVGYSDKEINSALRSCKIYEKKGAFYV